MHIYIYIYISVCGRVWGFRPAPACASGVLTELCEVYTGETGFHCCSSLVWTFGLRVSSSEGFTAGVVVHGNGLQEPKGLGKSTACELKYYGSYNKDTHIHTHTYIYIYIYIYIFREIHVYAYMHTHTFILCMYNINKYIYIYICMYKHMFIYAYLCVYIHIDVRQPARGCGLPCPPRSWEVGLSPRASRRRRGRRWVEGLKWVYCRGL